MTTAVMERPAHQPANNNGTGQQQRQPLWLGRRLPIILLSGEVNSGKTLFPLLIDPDNRALDHDPTTIVWDLEGSAEPYAGSLNFEWKDVRAAIMDGVHMQVGKPQANDPKWRQMLLQQADCNDYPSTSLFRAWYMSLLSIPRGKYRVGSTDTFTPIQEGLIEWLKAHPGAFGRTTSQYQNASSMFLWPDVKAMLSYILSVDCRLRFETFCLTVHLKNAWANGAKTGERIAEGLDVLDKLCTLHLRLDRKAESKKKSAPRLPSAIVIKQRFVTFGTSEEEGDKPILPPRLPEATPSAIRAYIANPPDFANLKPEERMPDDALSEDEKLRMRVVESENNRVVAEAELSRLEKMQQAAAAQAARMAASMAAAGHPVEQPQQTVNTPALISPASVAAIANLFGECFATEDELGAWLRPKLAAFGVERIPQLTLPQGDELELDLRELLAQKRAASSTAAAGGLVPFEGGQVQQAAGEPSVGPQRGPSSVGQVSAQVASASRDLAEATTSQAQQPPQPLPISSSHLETIKSLFPQAFASDAEAETEIPAMLAQFGVEKITAMTSVQADAFIAKLRIRIGSKAKSPDATGPDAPGSITNGQFTQLQQLADSTGWVYDQQLEWLKSLGLQSHRGLSFNQAAEKINQLTTIKAGFEGSAPGN